MRDRGEAPAAGLRRSWSVSPTIRGWAFLSGGAGLVASGLAIGVAELLAIGSAAVALVVLACGYLAIRRPRLTAERAFWPRVAVAEAPVDVTLALRNPSRIPGLPALVEDAVPWPEQSEPTVLPSLSGAAGRGRRPDAATLRYRIVPPSRGAMPIGPLVAEIEDPFRVARLVRATGRVDELLVTPRPSLLAGAGVDRADGLGVDQLVHRFASGNDDDITTREYRLGDPLRRVHWRASARLGELMVRQEEQRSQPRARILVDTGLDGYPDAVRNAAELDIDQSEGFEWAVRMLASLGGHLATQGFAVDVHETAQAQLAAIGERTDGGGGDEAFLLSLARIRLLTESSTRLDATASGGGAGGPVFAVLSGAREAVVDWMLAQRAPRERGTAFVIGDETVAARFERAGWRVVLVDPDDDPSEAWVHAHSRQSRVDARG